MSDPSPRLREGHAMNDEQGFLRILAENPTDNVTRLVYADWLEERQDARAHFLRLLVTLGAKRQEAWDELQRPLTESPATGRRERWDRCERLYAEARATAARLEELRGPLDVVWMQAVRFGVHGPRLRVLRGQKRLVEYPLFEGANFIGRADEKPVDIDLEEQEPPDRIWCARQHACIEYDCGRLWIEDLNSAGGTYVNRTRVYVGTMRPLQDGDVIQIGSVQLKVI